MEEYVAENRNSAAARFLLAYQYMVCGHTDAAATELKAVGGTESEGPPVGPVGRHADAGHSRGHRRLRRRRRVCRRPARLPQQPGVEPKPVAAAALVGDWKASRPDGATISLKLTQDGHYIWRFDQQGKQQEFSGAYTVADGLLILKKDDTPMMVGQVTPLASGFNFKLPGDNPNDPGLNFTR